MKFTGWLRWLAQLAHEKPIIFSVVLLLTAVISLTSVIKYEEKKHSECVKEKELLQEKYEIRVDSLNKVCELKIVSLNNELKQTLNEIIGNYKNQLSEQQKLNKVFRKITKSK